MLLPDTYFLTEAVSLETQQLIQRGIHPDKDRKEFQYEGPYAREKQCQWDHQILCPPKRSLSPRIP